MFVCLFVSLFLYLFVSLFICLFVYLFICFVIVICLFLCFFLCLSFCLISLIQYLFVSSEIQKLVLDGQISHAIKLTKQVLPGLLEQNANLLFTLRCRQFIEMVAGVDTGTLDTDSGDDIIIALSPTLARQPTPESEAMDTSGVVSIGNQEERHVFADSSHHQSHRSPSRLGQGHHGKAGAMHRTGSREKVHKSPTLSSTEISLSDMPNILEQSCNNATVHSPTNGGSHTNGVGVVNEDESDDEDDIIDGMITNGAKVDDEVDGMESNEMMDVDEVGERVVQSVSEVSSSSVQSVCTVPVTTRTGR